MTQQCRFIRPWQNYRVGDVISPNGTLRDALVSRGYIVVDEKKPEGTAKLGKARANLGRAVTRAAGDLLTT